MERTKALKLLRLARACGCAIPHFNYSGYGDLLAILRTAAEEHAPVFVASLPVVANAYSPEVLQMLVEELRTRTGCTALHHLDHSTDPTLCRRAVDAGYDSVMIDASRLPLEENVAQTQSVALYAHKRGCLAEGEIGRIRGRGVEGDSEEFLVRADEAQEMAQRSGVDLLAIGIGTQHGFYHGEPEIRFDRLDEVVQQVEIPLVLHGGTGIPWEAVRRSIRGGIVKVNVGTIIRTTYLEALHGEIERRGAAVHPLELIDPAVTIRVQEVVRTWIHTCNAQGLMDRMANG